MNAKALIILEDSTAKVFQEYLELSFDMRCGKEDTAFDAINLIAMAFLTRIFYQIDLIDDLFCKIDRVQLRSEIGLLERQIKISSEYKTTLVIILLGSDQRAFYQIASENQFGSKKPINHKDQNNTKSLFCDDSRFSQYRKLPFFFEAFY